MPQELTRAPKSFFEKFLDRIFVMRIFMHFPFSGILMLGYHYGVQREGDGGFWAVFIKANAFNWKILVSYLLFYLLMGGTYIINQIADKKSDLINRKNFFVSDGHISTWSAVFEASVIYFIVLCAAFYFSFAQIFAGGMAYFYVILSSVALGLMYSVKPFRLNARPGADMIANAFGYGFLNLAAGFLTVSLFDGFLIKSAVPIVLIGLAGFGSTTIADIEGDRKDGKNSIGVFLGETGTYIISIVLYCAALVISIIFRNIPCIFASAIAIPAHLFGLLKKTKKSALVTMRISNAGLVLISFVLFPVLTAAFLTVFTITKIFYLKRFGINYPSLTK
ncbi:UbiA family prenyltransferase [candidate division WOR-3 bacterium]|nr:UbiA family prenyltransferase [candidate division WOR-3 bacterium]